MKEAEILKPSLVEIGGYRELPDRYLEHGCITIGFAGKLVATRLFAVYGHSQSGFFDSGHNLADV
jgi:hypothetical protein